MLALNLKQGFDLGAEANAYDGGGRCVRDGVHGGMDVREVAEMVVLQEGGRLASCGCGQNVV